MFSFWRHLKVRDKLLLGFSLIGLIYVVSALFMLRQLSILHDAAHRVITVDNPAEYAVTNMQFDVLMGRILFEELLRGEDSVSFESVSQHWDTAKWYAEALLNGGENKSRKFLPVEDAAIRDQLGVILRNVENLSQTINNRHQAFLAKRPGDELGSALDQRADTLFDETVERMNRIEEMLVAKGAASDQLIFDAYTTARWELFITLGLVLGGGIIIALLFSRHAVSRPLSSITSIVSRMREGDFTQRAGLLQRDEFGQLAEGFDRMAEDLTALVREVQQAGIKVTTSSTEIAATAKQQEATVTEQTSTTMEIVATARQISATSKELVETMNSVAAVAEDTATLAANSQASLARMEEIMHRVTEASGSIASKLAALNERAANISAVVTTITKVADQTNLLSLNAAIEAEKAGEYGLGFAVVAREIRRLADQTAVATYDIEQIVKEVQSAVSAGVMGMDKFSEEVRRGVENVQQVSSHLAEVINQVQALAPRFEEVNQGMRSQSQGAQQISEAMAQLGEAAQQTLQSLQQSSQVIQQLSEAARGLQTGVTRFKVSA